MLLGDKDTVRARTLVGKDPDQDDITLSDVLEVLYSMGYPAVCLTPSSLYLDPPAHIPDAVDRLMRCHLDLHLQQGGAAIVGVPAQPDHTQSHAVVVEGEVVLDPYKPAPYASLNGLEIRSMILVTQKVTQPS